MPAAWHHNGWWDWRVSEDPEIEIDPVFIELIKVYIGSIQIGSIAKFCLLRYGNIYKSKFIKVLNHKFIINRFKYCDQKLDIFYA